MLAVVLRRLIQPLEVAVWKWPRSLWMALTPWVRKGGWWMPWAFWFVGLGLLAIDRVYLPWSDSWPREVRDADPVRTIAIDSEKFLVSAVSILVDRARFTWNAQVPSVLFRPLCLVGLSGLIWTILLFISSIPLAPLHAILVGAHCRPKGDPVPYGSASWGSVDQARRAGLLDNFTRGHSFILGRTGTSSVKRGNLFFKVPSHVLTLAPNGTGKGVGCVIPNLLAYPGPVVCLDIKGENYAVTARARRQLGQKVYRLDPFGLAGKPSHGFNWLTAIDLDHPSCVADAGILADAIVIRDEGTESFWDDSAAALMRGLVLHVASLTQENRHAGMLRTFLALSGPDFHRELEAIALQDDLAFGVPARMARMFLAKEPRERSSVVSTALRHTAFLDDPRVVQTLSHSDLDFGALKRLPATVFLMVPAEMVTPYRRYLRATLDLALRAMYRHPPGRQDVLFLLDEFAQLGRCSQLEDAISLVRGYGVRFWILCQDISQLRGTYRRWQTFLANTTQQIFGTQDLDTARMVSETIGQTTISLVSSGHSATTQGQGHNSLGSSHNEHAAGRPLITPDEVLRMRSSYVIVFAQGQPPFQLDRLNYLEMPELRGKWDPNPMHAWQEEGDLPRRLQNLKM